MNKIIIFLVYLVLSKSVFAGHGVGNGGGISENNFVFAFYNIDNFLKYAKGLPSAEFESEELSLIDDIQNTIDQEFRLKDPLIFLSGRKYPNIFIYPFGEVRIAVTGSEVGSPIYINTDLLYREINNQIIYITIPQAVSIIVHELGHHHKIKDEFFLNTLGAKVSMSIYKKFEVRKLRDEKNIYVEYANLGNKGFPQVLISDSLNTIDLTEEIEKVVRCPRDNSKPVGAEIWQTRWTRQGSPNWYFENELILYCKDNNRLTPLTGFSFIIVPKYIRKEETVYIKEVQTYLKVCDPRTSLCLARKVDALEFIINRENNSLEEK